MLVNHLGTRRSAAGIHVVPRHSVVIVAPRSTWRWCCMACTSPRLVLAGVAGRHAELALKPQEYGEWAFSGGTACTNLWN